MLSGASAGDGQVLSRRGVLMALGVEVLSGWLVTGAEAAAKSGAGDGRVDFVCLLQLR